MKEFGQKKSGPIQVKDLGNRGGFLFSAGLLLLAAFNIAPYASSYVNPLKGDLDVHDPVMIKEGSAYYIYYTGALIPSKTSTDRITWRNTTSGLAASSWIKTYVPGNNGTDFWAPDICFRDSKYWLYYSVSTFGFNTSAIGLATSPTLSNPTWTDQGMVIRSQSNNNYNGIRVLFYAAQSPLPAGRLYTISGRAILSATHNGRANTPRIPQGIFIIDSRDY